MTETETVNPYTPPPATSTPPVDEYCDVPIVSVRGRIGRLRFLAYGMGLNVVMTLLVGAVAAATTALSESAGAIVTVAALVLVYGGALLLLVFWTIRRVHDCNLNGWFTLLFMVPPIGLALWFVPGTQGENRYGLGPPPNRAGLIVLALLMLFVAVLGILAAIAIPAYQDYTVRTKIQGSVNLASPARRNLDLACREQSLQAGMRNAELGLAEPGAYSGPYTQSVEASVIDADHATIVVTHARIGGAVEAGETTVLTGRCGSAGMHWEVGGTAPGKYWPRV